MSIKISKIILNEIEQILSKVNDEEINNFISTIIKNKKNKIVCAGAGRVGNAIWAFSMRLGHLGFNSYCIGDSTTPSIKKGDLLIVASGSGETETIYHLVKVAKNHMVNIALITGNKDSRMGHLSDITAVIPAPSKTRKIEGFKSIQPMTTLNEQCLNIFFDTVVIELMRKMKIKEKHMWDRHSKLE